MSRDKQIEEMCKIACQCNNNGTCIISLRPCNCECITATELGKLYNAGYRKASEVARVFRQRMNEKMGKHTHLLGKEYVQRIMREIEKELSEGKNG